ncbi:MAG: 4Fe-4S dicluster domain-containing protein [Anaerolineaceae bacterium]|nr:4Fe-4S dicluster domain-containing protein [Anaerolineaceae bacterium]
MRFGVGYEVVLSGKPSGEVDEVELLSEPGELYLPLRSGRFEFSEVLVSEGQSVGPGHCLATAPGQFNVPLLAPRAGTVRLERLAGHVVLEKVRQAAEEPYHADEHSLHIPPDAGSSGMRRHKLLSLGAWQFFQEAHSGRLPNPFAAPRAIIVCVMQLDSFLARGDVQLGKRLLAFTRGLEHLQSLLEYQPIYLVTPQVHSPLADDVQEHVRGYAWIQSVTVPCRYPFDNFALLARRLGLPPEDGSPVWSLRVEGVLAVDRALTLSRPSTVRIVSVGGPAVDRPRHVKAMAGYPLSAIPGLGAGRPGRRVIAGGVMTGCTLDPEQKGLDSECTGLTVLSEAVDRELLGFLRPGFRRRSYSRCFASSLLPLSRPPQTAALGGEARACVSCGQCEEVCPVKLLPQVIHRYLYRDLIDEAERVRVDLCVGCGLCSLVCPSKIELGQEFLEAQEALRREHAAEAEEAQA